MKKFLCSFLLAAALIDSASAQQRSRLSAHTMEYLHSLRSSRTGQTDGYILKTIAGRQYMSALIKVESATQAAQGLASIGAITGTKAGDIWTVQVPADKVADFTALPGIAYVQLDEPVFPALDVARVTTGVDSVHRGINLPMPYSGRDVLVGVIDFGFDYNHPTFYDTTGTRFRIHKVWELNGSGTPPNGYAYGNEIADTNLIKARGTDNPVQGHGTAVGGIAAGSGWGSLASGTKCRGMAYESDLVMVGVRRDSIGMQWMTGGFSDFIDGVAYIFAQAAAMGKPAVVNISWGSQSGAHDGTSLFNQACNALSGPGRIIVMSAGNDGQDNIHLSKTFAPTDTVIKSFLRFYPTAATKGHYKRTWIDVWGEPGKTFCARTMLFGTNLTTPQAGTATYCLDNSVRDTFLLSAAGDTCYIQYITALAEGTNGKPRMTINIWNKTSDTVGFEVRSTSGSVHIWNEYYYYGFPGRFSADFSSYSRGGWTNGNTVSTVSDMGSAQSVMLIGSYNSKISWTDINGINQSYINYTQPGRISPFSSRGPMVDGRIKPDIAAPGLTLATAVSSYDTATTPTGSNSGGAVSEFVHPLSGRKYYYGEFIGTSASAPAASGIIALMLQAHPTLTPEEVRAIIGQTAIRDGYMAGLPPEGNNIWGKGKINAYGALRYLAEHQGVYQYSGRKLDCVLFPNPNKGSFLLSYQGTAASTLRIDVVNATGAVVASEAWSVGVGNSERTCSYPQLTAGTYLVRVSGAGGSVTMKMLVE